jgi:GT2 family glycosyltransferase
VRLTDPKVNAVSIVIPTYRRPGALLECVRSILAGKRRPDEIIVVGRKDDILTREALSQVRELHAEWTVLRAGWVTEAGHIPPVSKGLELASGEIVVFVDDDVTVTPDWLDRLASHFGEQDVAVVGGHVITPGCGNLRLKGKPGCTSWYGKHWGNVASLEGDSVLEVESVMECNWAWRRELLASLKFDPVLNFDDASMYGLDLCLQARSKGCRVLYEPRAVVHHHVAPRTPDLDRSDRTRRSFSYSRNYTYIMLKHLPWLRCLIFLIWWFLIGERGSRGLAVLLADGAAGRLPGRREMWRALSGKLEGIHLCRSGVRVHA